MFNDIKFNKKIQKHFLVEEYFKLKNNRYIKNSDKRYKKVNNYLSKFLFQDKKNNKYHILKKEIEKEYNNYKNLIYLKTKELERVRRNENLIPIFITLTLPSKYHPFKKSKNGEYRTNKNFEFIDLEGRINRGYKKLNEIWREFYLNVKTNKKNKNMKFIKSVENHKSLQVHIHRILYINQNTYNSVLDTFNKIIEKYQLKQVVIDKCIEKDEEVKIGKLEQRRGSTYIIKYMLKNFQLQELKQLDGWKKTHKIRMFSMSKLELNTEFFKKLYYSNKDLNIQILKKIKEGKSKWNNLYHFYTENTQIKRTYYQKVLVEKKDKNGKVEKDENGHSIFEEKIEIKRKDNGKKGRFTIQKIIEIKDTYINKKEVQEKGEDFKSIQGLKNIYYSNKYKKLKLFYEIEDKNHDIRYGKIYFIKLYQEVIKSLKSKSYKNHDFRIYDNELKESILEKNNFNIEYLKI